MSAATPPTCHGLGHGVLDQGVDGGGQTGLDLVDEEQQARVFRRHRGERGSGGAGAGAGASAGSRGTLGEGTLQRPHTRLQARTGAGSTVPPAAPARRAGDRASGSGSGEAVAVGPELQVAAGDVLEQLVVGALQRLVLRADLSQQINEE